jgi:hypothetical protein
MKVKPIQVSNNATTVTIPEHTRERAAAVVVQTVWTCRTARVSHVHVHACYSCGLTIASRSTELSSSGSTPSPIKVGNPFV